MKKKYGMPYQGSKNAIAEEIVAVLPVGKRLIDLFGGGGAISHCAAESGKWETVVYNDYNPLAYQLFKDAVHGKYNPERFTPEWISREEFQRRKDQDGYVKYIWSFGNNGRDYLYGQKIEERKRQVFEICKSGGERSERLIDYERLERLQNLEALERLQNLEFTNIDYKDYQYKDGDIVYCDIPYQGTKQYDEPFDYTEFYLWAQDQPYPVFFSSYELDYDFITKVWQKEKMGLMAASGPVRRTEYLYRIH